MRLTLWALFLILLAYFGTLNFRPMVTPDEFRYAEIASEMLDSGNYLDSRLLTLRYYEKPPLVHMLNAFSLRIFGRNAFAVRFVSAFLTVLTGIFTALLIWRRRRDSKLAWMSFGFFSSFLWVYILGTTTLTDAPLSFFIATGTFSGFLAIVEGEKFSQRLWWCVICAICLAGGLFSKGLLGIAIPGATLATFIIWDKRYKAAFKAALLMIPLLALTILPLAFAIDRTSPDFWNYFINVEHLQRFTDGSDNHPQPWYFLIPFLFLGGIPGIFFLPCGFAGKKFWSDIFATPVYKLALCGIIFPMILLSASGGKLPTYILPCFPMLAIILAGMLMKYLRELTGHRTFGCIIRIWSFLIFSLGVLSIIFAVLLYSGVIAAYLPENSDLPFDKLKLMIGCCGIVGVISGALTFLIRHGRRTHIMLSIFGTFAFFAAAINLTIPSEINPAKFPGKDLNRLKEICPVDYHDAMIVVSPSLMHCVAYELHRPDLRTLNGLGELLYGETAAAKRHEPTIHISTKELLKIIAQKERKKIIFFCRLDKRDLPAELKGCEVIAFDKVIGMIIL